MKFKPLWMIHNAAYRQYRKGGRKKKFEKYLGKLKTILRARLHIR